jgi:hypothetical protein
MKAVIAYFTAFCLISMGCGMGFLVLLPSVVKYQTFKNAPEAKIIKFIKLKQRYRRKTEVEYVYEFKNKEYTSKQFASFPTFTQNDERFRAVQKIRSSGGKPSCYVNPSDPSDAVLVNSFEYFSFWMLTLGFFAFPLTLGCYSIYCGRYEQKKANKSAHPTRYPLSS